MDSSPFPIDPAQMKRQALLSVMNGSDQLPLDPNSVPPGSDMPTPGAIDNGTNPPTEVGTKQPNDPKVIPDATKYDTSGLDPNNPIDAIFLKNKYARNGRGSGFGDLDYWREHPSEAARLDADQRGVGTDMPGPGDVGNKSFDPNVGKVTGGAGLVPGGASSGIPDLSESSAQNPDMFLKSLMDYARQLILHGNGGSAQPAVDKGALLSQMNG